MAITILLYYITDVCKEASKITRYYAIFQLLSYAYIHEWDHESQCICNQHVKGQANKEVSRYQGITIAGRRISHEKSRGIIRSIDRVYTVH